MAFLFLFHAATGTGWTVRSFLRVHATARDLICFLATNAPPQWLHLWFLWALFYAYLFASVWFGDGKRFATAGPLGLLLLVCTAAFQEFAELLPFQPSLSVLGHQVRFCHVFVFRCLPFFLLGVWSRFHEDRIRSTRIPIAVLGGLVASGAVLAILEAHWTCDSQFYLGNFLMVAGMVVWAIRRPTHSWRPAAFIGKNLAFVIYIAHMAVGVVLFELLRRGLHMESPTMKWVCPILVALGSIAVALCSWFFLRYVSHVFSPLFMELWRRTSFRRPPDSKARFANP